MNIMENNKIIKVEPIYGWPCEYENGTGIYRIYWNNRMYRFKSHDACLSFVLMVQQYGIDSDTVKNWLEHNQVK